MKSPACPVRCLCTAPLIDTISRRKSWPRRALHFRVIETFSRALIDFLTNHPPQSPATINAYSPFKHPNVGIGGAADEHRGQPDNR
jgi:hypothetical protein